MSLENINIRQNVQIHEISQPATEKTSKQEKIAEVSNKAQAQAMSKPRAASVSADKTGPATPRNGTSSCFAKGSIPKENQHISRCLKRSEVKKIGTSLKKSIASGPRPTFGKEIKTTSAETNTTKEVKSAKIEPPKSESNPQIDRGMNLLKNMRKPDLSKNESLDTLHQQNINTPQEVITGYKGVMSTKDLFTCLAKAYSDPKATKEEKQEYQNFASSWLGSKLHNHDLNNAEAKQGIQAFMTECLKDKGELFASGQKLNNSFHEASVAESKKQEPGKGAEIKSFSNLAEKCGNDPKKIAKEFRTLFTGLQTKITVDDRLSREADVGKKENTAVDAANANQKLFGEIANDILSSSSKKEATEKYKMYIKVADEAMKSGDTATLMPLLLALSHGSIEKLELMPAKNIFSSTNYAKILDRLNTTTSTLNSSRELKKMMQDNPNAPFSIESTIDKELIMLKEGNPKIHKEGDHSGKISADFIDMFSKQTIGFAQRQSNMRANNAAGNVDLESFLKNTPPLDANTFYDRSKAIRDPKGGWA